MGTTTSRIFAVNFRAVKHEHFPIFLHIYVVGLVAESFGTILLNESWSMALTKLLIPATFHVNPD
jgi:hypothetical protein